jgi:hypothetical protein
MSMSPFLRQQPAIGRPPNNLAMAADRPDS